MESQKGRISRLGNPDNIWYGMSGFQEIHRWPCNEHVTLPFGYAVKNNCAGCGSPLKTGSNKGTLQYAVEGVVKHLTPKTFEVFHPGCAEPIPFDHDRKSVQPLLF